MDLSQKVIVTKVKLGLLMKEQRITAKRIHEAFEELQTVLAQQAPAKKRRKKLQVGDIVPFSAFDRSCPQCKGQAVVNRGNDLDDRKCAKGHRWHSHYDAEWKHYVVMCNSYTDKKKCEFCKLEEEFFFSAPGHWVYRL